MPKPYPTTGKPVEPVKPERPPAPPSVLNAVKLMYAGAAASTVSLVIFAASIGAIRSENAKARPRLTDSQLSQFIITSIVYAVISVALWLWMARANGEGKNWARITASVLFALATLDLYGLLNYPKTALSLVLPVVTWIVGLGAVILLWRRESTAYFRPQARG